jgi:hypothetical protein
MLNNDLINRMVIEPVPWASGVIPARSDTTACECPGEGRAAAHALAQERGCTAPEPVDGSAAD